MHVQAIRQHRHFFCIRTTGTRHQTRCKVSQHDRVGTLLQTDVSCMWVRDSLSTPLLSLASRSGERLGSINSWPELQRNGAS